MASAPPHEPDDRELIALFATDPERAWDLFLARYAEFVLGELRRLGFDYDEALDRFVFVCEKLADKGFRRLRTIRFLSSRGELVPWLRQVVRNLVISWTWSQQGRRRLLRPIARLPRRDQRVFQLYFWRGLRPSEVYSSLKAEEPTLRLLDVYDSLERVFANLTAAKVWGLWCQLARGAPPQRIDAEPGEDAAPEIVDPRPSPEEALLTSEADARLRRAVAGLAARDRLILALRYEDGLERRQIAELLAVDAAEVELRLRRALEALSGALT